jgi:hypothetical protein
MVKLSRQTGDSTHDSRGTTGSHARLNPERPKSFYKLDAPNELALAAEPQRSRCRVRSIQPECPERTASTLQMNPHGDHSMTCGD